MNLEFVPVALKAALVNNPPPGCEGQLYAEIGRSKPAPQGICVANSAGKVLAWALSFDDEASVTKFLDYARHRFEQSPDAAEPVVAQRFMKFPSRKLEDFADTGRTPSIPEEHVPGDRCPAEPVVQPGTLVGRIVGRPLDDEGQPIAKTTRQEDYMEARFEVPVGLQRQFARAVERAADNKSIAVPDEFARLLVSHAYLGQLDVNPLGGRQTGGQTDSEDIAFRVYRVSEQNSENMFRITGTSDVAGSPASIGIRTDGRQWEHRVRLDWEGYVSIRGDRIVQLVISAQGSERLRWGSQRWSLSKEPDVAHLMAGHPIDLDCKVRYGLLAAADEDEKVGELIVDPPAQPGYNATPGLQQRLAHMREAVKHLRAAGSTELAERIEQQIKRMEQP